MHIGVVVPLFYMERQHLPVHCWTRLCEVGRSSPSGELHCIPIWYSNSKYKHEYRTRVKFDKIPYMTVTKIEKSWYWRQTVKWITEWLSSRTKQVCVNGTLSDWKVVLSSVLQGSVLGTILFLYYAALLPRRGPHIASHSVRLSVCPSVRPSR